MRVDTTSDWALLPSAPFTVVAANQLSGVTLSNAVPSNAAGARTRYVADFTDVGDRRPRQRRPTAAST